MKNIEKLEKITTQKALMILRLHFENHDYKFLFEVSYLKARTYMKCNN